MTLPDALRWPVRAVAGSCPHAGCWPPNGPGGHIYRSSFRSVTMRCPECGLTWTVTAHQMAKAARRLLDSNSAYKEVVERDVLLLERWAAEVSERRGHGASPAPEA